MQIDIITITLHCASTLSLFIVALHTLYYHSVLTLCTVTLCPRSTLAPDTPGLAPDSAGVAPGTPGANPGHPRGSSGTPGASPGHPGAKPRHPGGSPRTPGASPEHPGAYHSGLHIVHLYTVRFHCHSILSPHTSSATLYSNSILSLHTTALYQSVIQ